MATPKQPAASGSTRQYLVLLGLSAAIGIPAALLAYGFMALVHLCEEWLWTDLPQALGETRPPWFLVVGLPVAGAAVVCLARLTLPGDGGHPPIEGIGGGATPWRHAPGIVVAAIGTLAFGAVLGPEAPLIALGSAVGTAVLAALPVRHQSPPDPMRETVWATAGSFSAVSALFGGPLVAGMLLLEGGLAAGAGLIPALLPGLVAAAIGYVLFVGLGDWGGLVAPSLAVPDLPAYEGTRLWDLGLAVVVGVLATLVISQVRRLAAHLASYDRDRRSMVALLLLGGLAVGLLAQLAVVAGADSDEVLFSGQAAVPEVLGEGTASVLLVLLGAKALGYAISLGCGFRGGPIFPAIFIGIAIATFAVDFSGNSVTWAVAVGAAAGMAGGSGLVFSSLLFSMLLVGSAGQAALPAAVFAVAAAWLTRAALSRGSATPG